MRASTCLHDLTFTQKTILLWQVQAAELIRAKLFDFISLLLCACSAATQSSALNCCILSNFSFSFSCAIKFSKTPQDDPSKMVPVGSSSSNPSASSGPIPGISQIALLGSPAELLLLRGAPMLDRSQAIAINSNRDGSLCICARKPCEQHQPMSRRVVTMDAVTGLSRDRTGIFRRQRCHPYRLQWDLTGSIFRVETFQGKDVLIMRCKLRDGCKLAVGPNRVS